MKIINAKNPVRVNATTINLQVQFEELQAEGYLPFSATPTDQEPHGRELYQRANAGEFGPVIASP